MSKSVVVTTGDPAGCGPFITLKAIEKIGNKKINFFVVGDKKILKGFSVYKKIKKRIEVIDVNTPGVDKVKKGTISKLGGKASLSYLNKALEIIKREKVSCLVTAPVSKEAIRFTYPKFKGHTEFLASKFGVKKFCMAMVSRKLKVVLVTRHIPLSRVPLRLNKKELLATFELVYNFLKYKYKLTHPRIAVSSVNPHAGVDTFLGKEERIIKEAIDEFPEKVFGPYPADTLFLPDTMKKFDFIITCYHDQGMIPFKLLSFREGVNVTLGLPIVRTSPTHGVAFDVVRDNKPIIFSSMAEAIKLAYQLAYEIQ